MLHHLDHLVLTVSDIDATVRFYADVLGLEARTFGGGRTALHAPGWKINLHEAAAPIAPHAAAPTPGSADLCFIVDRTLEEVERRLADGGVAVELGPVDRTGSSGPLRSVYVRDPDGNLVELSVPHGEQGAS
ncbi:MAG: VOC family protein [Propionibacteriales bacterium]|nr:VOC family protein [Propionibacteriales bacterium]